MQSQQQQQVQQSNDAIELSVILAILSARRWLIVLITSVIFALVTAFVSQLPSVFRADTTLMVKGGYSKFPMANSQSP